MTTRAVRGARGGERPTVVVVTGASAGVGRSVVRAFGARNARVGLVARGSDGLAGALAALRRMLPRDRGTIVQVGSALAFRGIPLQAAYCAAKHAIQGFTDSLRTELLHDRSAVRVTSVHLPALNTPQFEWMKTRMPRKPQSGPPIYQPEVAADAILWAVDHEDAEIWVGGSTVMTILGDGIAPRVVDRYLARRAYGAQQHDGLVEADRKDNLWQPVGGDHGAHGAFDARARDRSLQCSLWKRRRWFALAAAVLGAAMALRRVARAGNRDASDSSEYPQAAERFPYEANPAIRRRTCEVRQSSPG